MKISEVTNASDEDVKDKVRLKKVLSVVDATAIIVCTIIGAGIFVSPKAVLSFAGSPAAALGVWFFAGIVCSVIGLVYAELGLTLPQAGSDYTYVRETFGDIGGFLVIWVMFWNTVAARGVISMTFAENLCQMIFTGCSSPPSLVRLLAAMSLLILTAVNCFKTIAGIHVTNLLTFGKVTGLAVIIVAGIGYVASGNTDNIEDMVSGSSTDPGDYILAFYSATFAYGGIQGAINMIEEIREPLTKNILIAVSASFGTVTILYMLTNFAYMSVLPAEEFLSAEAVAISFSFKIFSGLFWLMPFFVACSTLGAVNSNIMNTARQMMAAARRGHLPTVFSFIHVERMTPIPILTLNALATLLILAIKDFRLVLVYTSYIGNIVAFGSALSLVIMRFKRKDIVRPFKLPLIVPIMLIVFQFAALVYPLISKPLPSCIALGLIASGIPVYFLLVRRKQQSNFVLKCTKYVTRLIQRVTMCVPEELDDHGSKIGTENPAFTE